MKQVILKNKEIKTVLLTNIHEENVYILSTTWCKYKAQRVEDTTARAKWAFASLDNSYTYWNGIYDTLEDLIKASLNDGDNVYEFNDFSEVIDAINTGAINGII